MADSQHCHRLTSPGLTVVVRAAPWAGDGAQQTRATRATSSVKPIEDTVHVAALATIAANVELIRKE